LNSLPCYNENEDCEEVTVEQSAAKHHKTSENQETDEDDTKCEQVTIHDARKFTAELYFISCRKAMKAILYLH
jgi:hypothetical protein